MATRTISNLGGNYNATGTWVEGVVPTSADDVVSTATSGQLTVNVTAAARSIDLTTYTSTLTMNSTWTISGASLTHTFGSGMNFAGTVGIILFNQIATLVQNTTNRIPNLSLTGGVKTLSTDMYVVNLPTLSANPNGNNIFISGNLGSPTATLSIGPNGTTRLVCDGSGLVAFQTTGCTIEINTTGTYSTYGQGMVLTSLGGTNPSFIFTAGNILVFNIILNKQTTATDNYTLDISRNITGVYYVSQVVGASAPNMFITLVKPLIVDLFTDYTINRPYTTDNTMPIINILGSGLSASVLSAASSFRTTSSTSQVPPTWSYRASDIKLNSDSVHNIGSLRLLGGDFPSKPTISSITASLPATINLGSKITSQVINYNFTDIDASGDEIVALLATLTRTTNVTNVYPTGGGGGVAGGSFTYVN